VNARKWTAVEALEALVGLGVALWGVAQWSVPAAAVAGGSLLFVFAVIGRRF